MQRSAILLVCLAGPALSGYSTNGETRGRDRLVAFTVAPVYVGPRKPSKLRPGEAVNHPSTSRYSTLDEELLARLDERNRAQDRFHPPANFEHTLTHANTGKPVSALTDGDVSFSKPVVTMTYDYPATRFEGKPKPSGDSFPVYDAPSKFPDSYPSEQSPPVDSYGTKTPSFDLDHRPAPVEYPGHYEQAFGEVPLYAQDPYDHDEIIYDHLPEDHFPHHLHHPHHPTTTEEPEMMDQRVNKRPYSYYYIGKKLWYLPLYFSIYFIIYIAALVLKSIARHKINFPMALANSVEGARSAAPSWMDYITLVLEGIEKYVRIPN